MKLSTSPVKYLQNILAQKFAHIVFMFPLKFRFSSTISFTFVVLTTMDGLLGNSVHSVMLGAPWWCNCQGAYHITTLLYVRPLNRSPCFSYLPLSLCGLSNNATCNNNSNNIHHDENEKTFIFEQLSTELLSCTITMSKCSFVWYFDLFVKYPEH